MTHGRVLWYAQLDFGTDPTTGRRIRPVRYAKTQREARAKLAELVRLKKQGELPKNRRARGRLRLIPAGGCTGGCTGRAPEAGDLVSA